MPHESITNTDPFRYNLSRAVVSPSRSRRDQIVSFTDIISEGPIKGLANGAASIFLDNNPAATKNQGGVAGLDTSAEFIFNGSVNVVATYLPDWVEPWSASDTGSGDKFLVINNLAEEDDCTAT